jgi:adenosylmethionine-8-amino-7-oxononanoate aminotransferase
MEIHVQSRLLLERLANSLYDRDPSNKNPVFFTSKESRIVEVWLKEVISKAIDELHLEEE